MRWAATVTVPLLLVLLLGLVQADLWFGRANWRHVLGLRDALAQQLQANREASVRNARVSAETSDLKEGLEMVEDKARSELGMLRPNEILVHVTPSKP